MTEPADRTQNERVLGTDAIEERALSATPTDAEPTVLDTHPDFAPSSKSREAMPSPAPSHRRIETLERNVRRAIGLADEHGFTFAAECLEDWLDGQYERGTKQPPGTLFAERPFLRQELRGRHRDRIIEAATRRLRSSPEAQFPRSPRTILGGRKRIEPTRNTLKPTDASEVGTATVFVEKAVTVPADRALGVALQTVTITSTATLTARRLDNPAVDGWEVAFEDWSAELTARYDRDAAATTVTVVGEPVTGDDLSELERAGRAAPYDIRSTPWRVTDDEAVEPFVVRQ